MARDFAGQKMVDDESRVNHDQSALPATVLRIFVKLLRSYSLPIVE